MIAHERLLQLRHVLGISFCVIFLCSCKKEEKLGYTFPEHLLHEGDIVFRCGTSMASNAVLLADKITSYSHIGIVVKQNNQFRIIHAVPDERDHLNDKDRVKIDSIETFFKPDRSIAGAIMRIDNETIATQAAAEAMKILERETLFDHDYDLKDSSKMYCTELIYYVYNKSGLDLTEGRRSSVNLPALNGTYIFPSDIQQNSILHLLYSY